MKTVSRRTLLTSSAAAMAASTMPLLQAEVAAIRAAPFIVRSGEGRPGGAHLIHGDKAFTTKVSGADVGRTYCAVEVHTPPGHGPEMHIHPGQNELFYVFKGTIGVQWGTDRNVLRPGDALMAPADIPHAFLTLGAEPAHLLNVFDPAGNMEGFFAAYAAVVNVDGEPDRKKLAEVYTRHGLKIAGPPLSPSDFSL